MSGDGAEAGTVRRSDAAVVSAYLWHKSSRPHPLRIDTARLFLYRFRQGRGPLRQCDGRSQVDEIKNQTRGYQVLLYGPQNIKINLP